MLTTITKELSGTTMAKCNEIIFMIMIIIISNIKQMMTTKGAMWLLKKN